MNKAKKIIVFLLCIIEVLCVHLTYKAFKNKPVIIDDIKYSDNIVNKKIYGIFVEKSSYSSESDKYEVYNGTTWPGSGYEFNSDKSICTDEEGNTISNALTYSNGTITLNATTSAYCYIYFDLIKPDITVVLQNYNEIHNTKSLNCTTGETNSPISSYYNTKYQALVFNDVKSTATNCTLTSSNTDLSSTKTTLRDTITGLITSGNIYEHQTAGVTDWALEYLPNESYGDYSNAAKLEYTGYNLVSEFYRTGSFSPSYTSSSSGSVAPPDVSLSWDSTNKYWVSDLTQSSLTTSRTYYYIFNVTEAGYYQVCYKKESGGSSNSLRLYKGTTNMYSSNYLTASSTSEVCVLYDALTTSDNIIIGHYTPSTNPAKLDIYIKKGAEVTTNVGYRYEGKKPSNYIWFNNEMWRIIGVIPTCTSSGCNTSENLVKIIRAQSIGGLNWHTSSNNTWNDTKSLYQVLNSFYLTKGNATGNSICKGTEAADCDYTVKGIGETSYYGSMIKNVYWNTGPGINGDKAVNTYEKERLIQSVEGKIGLMNASDYGYASITHNIALSSTYNTDKNWLYGQGYEWTITPNSTYSNYAFMVDASGTCSGVSTSTSRVVRPALYLNSSVYVVSGDGSEANPYQISM